MSDTPVAPTDSLKSPQFILSVMAVLMIAAGFGYMAVTGDATAKQTVLTALISLVSTVYGFWVGSSKSSQAKDDKPIPPLGSTQTTVVTTPPAAQEPA